MIHCHALSIQFDVFLTDLAFILYTPSNLDKAGLLEEVFVQILDNVLFLIVEDEVVGDERLDDRFIRWIVMMINFILSGLGIFAQVVRCSDREPRRQKGSH
jgi:hypothetical protein